MTVTDYKSSTSQTQRIQRKRKNITFDLADKAMQLNSARFSIGKHSGFVPKPAYFDNPGFNPYLKNHLQDLDPLLINLQVGSW